MENFIRILLILVGIYLVIGVVAYFPLVKKIIPNFDESMHETPLFFKILVFPGVVVFWLPLLIKWQQNQTQKP